MKQCALICVFRQKACLVCVIFWLATGVTAQAEPSDRSAHYTGLADRLFSELLENPADIMLNRQLLDAQIQAGQIKAAIASLERLDALAGLDPDTRLMRISLLVSIGNIAEAQAYLAQIDTARLSSASRQHVDMLDQKIQQIETGRNKRLFSKITASFGQNSNPDGASHGNRAQFYLPASQQHMTGTSSKIRKTDEVSEIGLSVRHITPHPDGFDWQLALSADSSFTNYGHHDDAYTLFYGVSATIEQPRSRFYAGLSYLHAELSDRPFVTSPGLRSGITIKLSDRTRLDNSLSVFRNDYHQPEDSPREGTHYQLGTALETLTAQNSAMQIRISANVGQYQADADWHGFDMAQLGLSASLSGQNIRHNAGTALAYRQFEAIQRYQDSGNPVYSATDLRTDKTASAFIDSSICLSGEASAPCSAIGLRTSFEQTVSNIVNFSRDEAAIKLYLAYYF